MSSGAPGRRRDAGRRGSSVGGMPGSSPRARSRPRPSSPSCEPSARSCASARSARPPCAGGRCGERPGAEPRGPVPTRRRAMEGSLPGWPDRADRRRPWDGTGAGSRWSRVPGHPPRGRLIDRTQARPDFASPGQPLSCFLRANSCGGESRGIVERTRRRWGPNSATDSPMRSDDRRIVASPAIRGTRERGWVGLSAVRSGADEPADLMEDRDHAEPAFHRRWGAIDGSNVRCIDNRSQL